MSGGAGGMRGGSGGMMNQFINPAAAGNGMMNGGPQANFNGMNVGNRQPFKGGTTEAQMQANVRNYLAAKNGQMPAGAYSNGVMGTNMDPRRSPDVAAPWRVAQPYAGQATGVVAPPNADSTPNPNAPGGPGISAGNYDPAMYANNMADIPYADVVGNKGVNPAFANGMGGQRPNMFAGGNPNFNERAPVGNFSGLLGRGSYR